MAKCELESDACLGQSADIHVVRKDDGKEMVICWQCWCHDQDFGGEMANRRSTFAPQDNEPSRIVQIKNFDPGHADPNG